MTSIPKSPIQCVEATAQIDYLTFVARFLMHDEGGESKNTFAIQLDAVAENGMKKLAIATSYFRWLHACHAMQLTTYL